MLLWTGETSVSKSKGFMTGYLGTLPKSPVRKRAEPGALWEEYSTELPFVIQGHRKHKIRLASNEKINFSFVPGAYITERSQGIKGLEMDVY